MKRLHALAAMAMLCLFALPAYAGTAPAQRWVSTPVQWRHLGSGVNVDSAVVRHGAASAGGYSGSTSLDTTVAFPLYQCEINYAMNGQAAAVDTTVLFTFNMFPTANTGFTAGTGDSLAVVTQVSMDGANWTTVSPTQGNSGAGGIITLNTTNVFNICLPITGSKGFVLPGKQALAATNAGWCFGTTSTATAPTELQYFGWKFARWIVSPNRLNGEWNAWVSYWTSQGTTNQ